MQHLTRDTIIGFIVLVLIGIGAVWYVATRPVAAPAGPVAATTTPASPATGPAHITDHSTYYDADAEYPSQTALSATAGAGADAAAVATMKQWEEDAIAQFKADGNFANLSHDDVQMMGLDQRKESFGITYEAHQSAHTVSYVFQIFSDTHGAHPNTTYKTFVFDSSTGSRLDLSDVLTGDYAANLSALARAKLPAQIAAAEQADVSEVDMDMLNLGTTADSANFEVFYFDNSDFVILFPPYAVGPYALGLVTLTVPASQVKGLNPRYP